MLSYTRLYDYALAQYQLQADYLKKVQDVYSNFQQDSDRIAADARNKARLLMENYYRELQAANLGDDTMERVSVARSNFQQEYAKLNQEYLTAIYNRYQSLGDVLPGFQLSAMQQALDDYIKLLQDAREELTA